MSVNNRPSSDMRRDKPDRSGNSDPKDLPYFALSRFDTRNSNVENNNNSSTHQKRPYDPDGILESLPVLECIFCDKYKTAIEFDMDLHLYEKHRNELLTQFPFRGKGYSMDDRIGYFINQIKIRGQKFEQIKTNQATPQAIGVEKKELIMTPTTKINKRDSKSQNDKQFSNNRQITATVVDDFAKNFPFPTKRDRQSYVLKEIDTAFALGQKYILLEAPTGFGKSPVAIAAALTLGSSYICTSTKDLQAQYARDFPYVKVAKGKNNFICAVKEDFIVNGTYKCGLCASNNTTECYHLKADYGPCMTNKNFEGPGCKYRTFVRHYQIRNKGMKEEEVIIDDDTRNCYETEYFQWMHLKNLKAHPITWRPCKYFHQLNIALASSHSILNYPLFFGLLARKEGLPSRELLVLDEAHLLETEAVKFREISILKRKWKKYIPNLRIDDNGYDVENWVDFLEDLEKKMIDVMKNVSEEVAIEALTDTNKLSLVVGNIKLNPEDWIVSDIKKIDNEVISVEFKPLDVPIYCKEVFEKWNKVLMMSATILDKDAFCKSLGLVPEEVKFIQVPSDFPLQNRPIYPLNIAYLNSNSL